MPNQNTFNCEHTWAQSWFTSSESTTKKADLHHLFPTYATVNSSRGNLPFDIVEDIEDTYGSGSWMSYRGDNENGMQVFEPADQHKGDLARAILYFHVRYNQDINGTIQDVGYNNIDMFSKMLEWHSQDPISIKESERNEGIYDVQDNRNPFIDHPEYVDYIWGNVSNENEVEIANLNSLNTYPNPFNFQSNSRSSGINVSFNTLNSTNVQIFVINIKGQKVAEVASEPVNEGKHIFNWNPQNNDSNTLSSGIYFMIVKTAEEVKAQKFLIVH